MAARTQAELGRMDHPPAEQRTTLHNVRWVTYEQLLIDLAGQSSRRLTYNQGTLEIMTPLPLHERLTRTIEMMINVVAEETETDIYCLGSTTFKREDLQRGFEPDTCFYIQNEARVRGEEIIDLRTDPPPDLVIEIDITSGSMNKLPIYAHIGVPEVWRHDTSKLVIYKLSGQNYTESSNSLAFPYIASTAATDFIHRHKNDTSTAFIKALRKWVRSLTRP